MTAQMGTGEVGVGQVGIGQAGRLVAYHNKPELKAAFVREMEWHAKQDKIVQRTYGACYENGDFRGCFVGCAVHSLSRIEGKKLLTSRHLHIEEYLGVPLQIAYLADAIFETLSPAQAREFALKIGAAIPVGADLSMVIPHYLYWTLTDDVKPTKYPQFQGFIDVVVAMYKEWTETGVRPADRASRAYRAYLADRADRAYLADRADRAYLADLADLAYLASRAYRAYLTDRADLAYRADRAEKAAVKLLELLAAAPQAVVETIHA